MASERNAGLESLLRYLKTSRGFDFTGYKRSTLTRRVLKRMAALKNVKTYETYQDYLEVHPEEFATLFNTVLINVTSFFRDAAAWDYLASKIIPRMLKAKRPTDLIRVCCIGCSSGEEAYSVAMLFAGALGEKAFRERVKIYATDVDSDALAQARHAIYSGKSVAAVPPKVRAKYFENSSADQFVVKADLRRAVIFGRLDLVHDAPISRLDLLICRNTLMYFNAETQARIIARFHFALNDEGLLFLGKSEMLLSHSDLFKTVDLENRIFSKAPNTAVRERLLPLQPAGDASAATPGGNPLGHQIRMRDLAFNAVPISQLVVDMNGRVVLVSTVARARFGIAPTDIGKPLQDLEISFRPLELRSLIQQAYADRAPVAAPQVKRTRSGGAVEFYEVQVTPLQDDEKRAVGATVSFVDVTRAQELQNTLHQTNEKLEITNEELKAANEELETTNEELQSTNEELETTNEELQSTNEELETMNEELQATNEELETTNDELQMRTDELNRANTFMHAVLSSLHVGVAVTNSRLEVIAWNETAENMWGVRAKEAQGQSLYDLGIGLPLDKLNAQIQACLKGKKDDVEHVLQAVDRRGKAIACKVTCKAFTGTDGNRGVTLVMEQTQ
jgi:two-component system, chemotaxis family, CheB/CheR fusion protein